MRDGLFRFGEPAGDDPAHRAVRLFPIGRVAGERQHLRLGKDRHAPRGGVAGAPACCPLPAGAAAANFSSVAASSPSSSRRAIGWLTLMPCAPSGTIILPMRPSSTASYSIVALSVSISAITSPECTSSPSFLSQRVRLPSVIVGDSAGIRISTGMADYR